MRNVYGQMGLDVDEKRVRWILLVPRAWDKRARDALRGCAQRAGLSAHHKLQLTKDDAAAVTMCRKTMEPELPQKESVRLVDVGEEVTIVQHIVRQGADGELHINDLTKSFPCGEERLDREFVKFLTAKFTNFASMVHSKPGALPPEVTAILVQWEAIKSEFAAAAGSHKPQVVKLEIPEKVHVSAAWKSSAEYPPPEHIVDGNRYELELTPADMSSIFDPVAEELFRTINQTVPRNDRLRNGRLFLLARSSSSSYLGAWVQQRAHRVVTVLPNPDRVLSHGAVLSGYGVITIWCLLTFFFIFLLIGFIGTILPIILVLKFANKGSGH